MIGIMAALVAKSKEREQNVTPSFHFVYNHKALLAQDKIKIDSIAFTITADARCSVAEMDGEIV